jgi:hypothetical protein
MLSPLAVCQAAPAFVWVIAVDALTSKPVRPNGAAGSIALVLVAAAKSLLNAKNSAWLRVLTWLKSPAMAWVLNAIEVAIAKVTGKKWRTIFIVKYFLKF